MDTEYDYRLDLLNKQIEFDRQKSEARKTMYEKKAKSAETMAKVDVNNEWVCPKCNHLNKPKTGKIAGWGVCVKCGEWKPS